MSDKEIATTPDSELEIGTIGEAEEPIKKKPIPPEPPNISFSEEEMKRMFCLGAKKYRLDKRLVMAVAMVESAWNPHAYRFEPKFWDRYLANNPEFNHMKPEEASASYGVMQIMYTTAVQFGFKGDPKELYDPVVNILLGCKILRILIDKAKTTTNLTFWPEDIALARYNGGSRKNPGPDGKLRNISYVKKVKKWFWHFIEEKDCDD